MHDLRLTSIPVTVVCRPARDQMRPQTSYHLPRVGIFRLMYRRYGSDMIHRYRHEHRAGSGRHGGYDGLAGGYSWPGGTHSSSRQVQIA